MEKKWTVVTAVYLINKINTSYSYSLRSDPI